MHNKYEIKVKIMPKDRMTKKTVANDLYRNLKRHHGAFKDVAERANCHRNWVRLVLNGSYEDVKVLEIAAEVLLEREKEVSERRDRARAMMKKALALAS